MNSDEIHASCFNGFDEVDGLAEVFMDSDFYRDCFLVLIAEGSWRFGIISCEGWVWWRNKVPKVFFAAVTIDATNSRLCIKAAPRVSAHAQDCGQPQLMSMPLT